MNYYERHLGDYARRTAHLSLLEHGVYSLLLDRYYGSEKPLPLDLKAVQRLVGARTAGERAAVKTVLEEFFTLTDEGWRNKRCDEEIERFREFEGESEERKRHETERKRRYRQRRSELFEALRDRGVVPSFDTSLSDLEAMLSRGTGRGQGRGQDGEGTATHYPLPTTHEELPESLQGGTRASARTPTREAADTVGKFEGHDQPATTPSPSAPFAIALNRLGVRCTPLNPDLVAYASEGGTVEHITAIAQHPECQGKPVAYIARFARRELAQPAAEITTTQPARITARTTDNAPSKRMQGLQALEEMKHGTVVPERNPDRPAEAVHALAGPNAKR